MPSYLIRSAHKPAHKEGWGLGGGCGCPAEDGSGVLALLPLAPAALVMMQPADGRKKADRCTCARWHFHSPQPFFLFKAEAGHSASPRHSPCRRRLPLRLQLTVLNPSLIFFFFPIKFKSSIIRKQRETECLQLALNHPEKKEAFINKNLEDYQLFIINKPAKM